MPEYERNYGPWVEVQNNMPGFKVAVLQTYRGERRSPVMWRGKVCIAFMDSDLMDIEGTLLESKQGGDPYFAMPERNYESNGQTKYQKVMYIHRKELMAALSEAVRLELGDSSVEDDPLNDDDLPL